MFLIPALKILSPKAWWFYRNEKHPMWKRCSGTLKEYCCDPPMWKASLASLPHFPHHQGSILTYVDVKFRILRSEAGHIPVSELHFPIHIIGGLEQMIFKIPFRLNPVQNSLTISPLSLRFKNSSNAWFYLKMRSFHK